MYCEDCKKYMIKNSKEYYCPICGLVMEEIDCVNIADFCQMQGSRGVPVYPWKSNIRQTKKMYYWRNRRMVLLINKKKGWPKIAG